MRDKLTSVSQAMCPVLGGVSACWVGWSILFTGVSDAAVLRLTTEADSTCFLQVFDDKNQFAEWFGDSFGKTAPGAGGEDDVAMEKRVVVIHRLHQILEPFMLRRQVQDVEGKLPPKVPPHSLASKIAI